MTTDQPREAHGDTGPCMACHLESAWTVIHRTRAALTDLWDNYEHAPDVDTKIREALEGLSNA